MNQRRRREIIEPTLKASDREPKRVGKLRKRSFLAPQARTQQSGERRVQARRAKALRASVSRRPCTTKKETPGQSAGCRVSSLHCVEEYHKLSPAILQSRQGRPIVARYVSKA